MPGECGAGAWGDVGFGGVWGDGVPPGFVGAVGENGFEPGMVAGLDGLGVSVGVSDGVSVGVSVGVSDGCGCCGANGSNGLNG